MTLLKALFAALLLAGAVIATAGRPPDWILAEKFLTACEAGDAEAVASLLKMGISPNSRDKFGQPAIFRAVRNGGRGGSEQTIAVLKLLIAAGADINAVNEFGSNALFLVRKPHPLVDLPDSAYKFLIAAGINAKHRDRCGRTADERGDPCGRRETLTDAVWRFLVEGGLHIKDDLLKAERHANSATFAMGVAYYGESYQVPLKFLAKADLDKNGETSLFYLAGRTRFNALELDELRPELLNVKNSVGETALIRAAQFDNDFLVRKLVTAGADHTTRDRSGRSALDYAAVYDYGLSTVTLLARADANELGPDGVTPLLRAVRNLSNRAVSAFVFAKLAAPNIAEAARRSGAKSDALLSEAYNRIDVNRADPAGVTPLMAAVEILDREIVALLLKLNPNKNAVDQKGRTALSIAKTKRNKEILELLDAR